MSTHSSHLPPTGPVPGFHSQVPYEIQPQDRDAIIRISAFHRKDADRLVMWFPAGTHTDTLTSTLPTNITSTATLGELDRLPLELINKICLELDMASLFRFRQVNTRARLTVDVLHEYRIITTHAMNAFCSVIRSGVTPNVTLLEFYRLLCTQTCSLCQRNYGNLVHVLLWIRCCARCLVKNSTEIQASTLNSVKRVLKLSKMSLAELPRLTTLPGIYTYEEIPRTMRMVVVSTASALEAYRKEHSGVEASQDMIEKLNTQWNFLFMVCCAFPCFDLRTRQAQNGVPCAGCQLAIEKRIIISSEAWATEMYCAVYSHDGFLEHFKHCEQAQLLWISSNGGTRQAPELPHLCQVGGCFGGNLRDDE